MSTRIKEDILYAVRALEGDLKIYEKQADVLFTYLNTLVASTATEPNCFIGSSELEQAQQHGRATILLEEQMVSRRLASQY